MLSGSLDLFTITDVLRLVSEKGGDGRLRVDRPEAAGAFLLSGGRVVGVENDDGAADDEDAAIDAALEIFDASAGTFDFEPGIHDGGVLSLSVDGLVERLDERRVQWDAVREAIGSVEAPLSLSAEIEGDTTLTAAEWRLLALAAGGRSARRIAAEAGLRTYEAAGLLSDLARRGLIVAGEAEAGADSGDDEVITLGARPAAAAPVEPVVLEAQPEDAKGSDDETAGDDGADDDGGADADDDAIELLRELGGSGPRKRPRLLTREEQRMRLRR